MNFLRYRVQELEKENNDLKKNIEELTSDNEGLIERLETQKDMK